MNIQHNEISQPSFMTRTKRALTVIGLATIAIGLSACAGLNEPGAGARSAPVATFQADTDRQHASLEAAALHALVEAERATGTSNVGHLRVGSIVSTNGGFTWLDPETSQSAGRPVIRLRVGSEHVATYIVHPATHTSESARMNERITREEMRLVNQMDPQHRPLFVMTPSGRLLKYSRDEGTIRLGSIRDHRNDSKDSPGTRGTAVAGNY